MMNIQASTYEIYDTYCIGIDVHKQSWKLAIRFNGQELRRVSMDPSAEQLRRYVDKQYNEGRFVRHLQVQRSIINNGLIKLFQIKRRFHYMGIAMPVALARGKDELRSGQKDQPAVETTMYAGD